MLTEGEPRLAISSLPRCQTCLRPSQRGWPRGQDSHPDQLAPHRKHHINSGKVWTAYSLMTKHVTWVHKLGYATDGKATVYDNIVVPLFVQWYLICHGGVKASTQSLDEHSFRVRLITHLKKLMEDAQLYGWEKVQGNIMLSG